MAKFVSENTKQALTTFAERTVKLARINLGSRQSYTDTDGKRKVKRIDNSGRLKQSLAYDLNVTTNAFSLSYLMEEYGQWVDSGRDGTQNKVRKKGTLSPNYNSGKGAPPRAIEEWVKTKPIRYRNAETGAFESMTDSKRKSLAYLINRKIRQKGIAPTKFFSEPFEREFIKLPDEVAEAYALDLEQFLQFTQQNYGN